VTPCKGQGDWVAWRRVPCSPALLAGPPGRRGPDQTGAYDCPERQPQFFIFFFFGRGGAQQPAASASPRPRPAASARASAGTSSPANPEHVRLRGRPASATPSTGRGYTSGLLLNRDQASAPGPGQVPFTGKLFGHRQPDGSRAVPPTCSPTEGPVLRSWRQHYTVTIRPTSPRAPQTRTWARSTGLSVGDRRAVTTPAPDGRTRRNRLPSSRGRSASPGASASPGGRAKRLSFRRDVDRPARSRGQTQGPKGGVQGGGNASRPFGHKTSRLPPPDSTCPWGTAGPGRHRLGGRGGPGRAASVRNASVQRPTSNITGPLVRLGRAGRARAAG